MRDSISKDRKIVCAILNAIMYVAVGIVCTTILLIVGCILYKGLSNVTWELVSSKPSLINGTVGILPNVLNTVYMVLITLMVAVPVGVGSAIYLNEYAKNRHIVKAIVFATETLSGIPSIVYGLVGMLIFVQVFSLGTSIVSGALTLSIMTLPIIIRTTQESLKSVPNSYREGALAMGAGRWYTVRTVVLPSAMDGIITGCILAIGRVVGESAGLLFTAGMSNEILNLFEAFMPNSSGATLTVSLYVYAKERGDFDTAFAIATILLILTFLINLLARLFTKRLRRR
jgi:phosphate transport system permease protein